MAESKKTVDETVQTTVPEVSEKADVQRKRITHSHIGNTMYIVESVQSPTAAETACNKVKRLILNNAARA
ncbi:MAG: transposon-encoded TnpW family protein [Clostridia bacterium]|nr:transposon-encoded TnpW family protein [Clostridia bacterium]